MTSYRLSGPLLVGESGLPTGGPLQRGISLPSDLPGQSTFAKPSQEPSRQMEVEDASMYKVDRADNLQKSQTVPDSIDWSYIRPTFQPPGPLDDTSMTRYPYRDGVPNRHNASRVASVWLSSKLAARLSDLTTSSEVKTKSRACSVTLKRADIGNMSWLFLVDCGNGNKLVRLKMVRKGRVVDASKMDVFFSCSCPAWRWGGSEYHAKNEGYLKGSPVGNASKPERKDPNGENKVCKHVYAVSLYVKSWKIPVK